MRIQAHCNKCPLVYSMHECMHICIHVCMSVYVNICIHVCICIYVNARFGKAGRIMFDGYQTAPLLSSIPPNRLCVYICEYTYAYMHSACAYTCARIRLVREGTFWKGWQSHIRRVPNRAFVLFPRYPLTTCGNP